MTISQSLIEQYTTQENPNDRVKYIHFRTEILLNESSKLTLDGKTFNGKSHLNAKFADGIKPSERKIRFDAATVAYKENSNGDLDLALVFKSPVDDYVKKVGANLSSVILSKYLEEKNKANLWHFTDHFGYNSFVTTINLQDLVEGEFAFPDYFLSQVGASNVKNTIVVKKVKEYVIALIEHICQYDDSATSWVPSISFE